MSLLLLSLDEPAGPPPDPSVIDDTMTINIARRAVYQLWLDEWVANPARPVTFYDNLKGRELSGNTSWASLVVREVASEQHTLGSIGSRRFMRTAVIIVTIRVANDIGTELADDYAQAARDIFEGVRLPGGLEIFQTDVSEVGLVGRWWEVVVRSLFHYYETK